MGYSNDTDVMLVLATGNFAHTIRRVHHTIIDDYGLSSNPNEMHLLHEQLLRSLYVENFKTTSIDLIKFKVNLHESQ